LVVASFLIVAAAAGHGDVAGNMQADPEAIHSIQVLN
jgi:hypothetical protein